VKTSDSTFLFRGRSVALDGVPLRPPRHRAVPVHNIVARAWCICHRRRMGARLQHSGKRRFTTWSVAQHPLTSVSEDVFRQSTGCLRCRTDRRSWWATVYGGAVITEAGNDSHVVGLVYIAAHALDEGENRSWEWQAFSPMPPKPSRKPTTALPIWTLPFITPTSPRICLRSRREFEAHAQALTAAGVFHDAGHPTRLEKTSRAGMPLPSQIASSILISSGCTPSVLTATLSKWRTPVTRSMSRTPKEVAALIEAAAQTRVGREMSCSAGHPAHTHQSGRAGAPDWIERRTCVGGLMPATIRIALSLLPLPPAMRPHSTKFMRVITAVWRALLDESPDVSELRAENHQ